VRYHYTCDSQDNTYINRRAISSVTTKVSRELYAEIFEAWEEVCKKLPTGVNLHFTIQPVSSGGVQAGDNRGGNILGLEKVPQCCQYNPTIILSYIT
jgi:hypothetical protein